MGLIDARLLVTCIVALNETSAPSPSTRTLVSVIANEGGCGNPVRHLFGLICQFCEFDRRRKIKTLVSASTCLQFLITEVLAWAYHKQFVSIICFPLRRLNRRLTGRNASIMTRQAMQGGVASGKLQPKGFGTEPAGKNLWRSHERFG
jgi:hypothetical protein